MQVDRLSSLHYNKHMNAKHYANSKNFYKRISPSVQWEQEGLCNRGYTFVNGVRVQVAEFLYNVLDDVSGWAYAEESVLIK